MHLTCTHDNDHDNQPENQSSNNNIYYYGQVGYGRCVIIISVGIWYGGSYQTSFPPVLTPAGGTPRKTECSALNVDNLTQSDKPNNRLTRWKAVYIIILFDWVYVTIQWHCRKYDSPMSQPLALAYWLTRLVLPGDGLPCHTHEGCAGRALASGTQVERWAVFEMALHACWSSAAEHKNNGVRAVPGSPAVYALYNDYDRW